MKEGSNIDIPYIELGTTIEIEIKGIVPDRVELIDSVLNEDGDNKYTLREDITTPITFSNRKGTFELDMHPAVFLSSNSEDYLPGKTMRGFKLNCSWGDNQCEYGFIVRTDAN